ncbi:MAG: SRPBCC family protein [Chloroflexota bacterium]
MSTMHIEESLLIAASPGKIYGVITDFEVGHKAILPPQFTDLRVEVGGQGEGTIAIAEMNVMGQKSVFRLHITEPEPGRVMIEADPDAGVETTWTLEPVSDTETKVTISSKMQTSAGIKGWIERLVTPSITQGIYKEELQLLADYVRA